MARRPAIAGRVPEAETAPPADVVTRVVRGLLVTILVLRWMVPTEGSSRGDTLWIAQFSLLLGVLWTWSLLRREQPRIRFGLLEGTIVALAGLHVVAALAVWMRGDGDARAAVNLAWEWTSAIVTFVVARNVVDTAGLARRLAAVVVALTVSLAVFGIWQHYVWFPGLSNAYLAEREELDHLTAIAPTAQTNDQLRRIAEIRDSFDAQGVPLEGAGRAAFENRLLRSREPLGRFALANTFAGWLLVGTFLLAGFAVENERRTSESSGAVLPRVLLLGALGVVFYALLLTKSRTASVGLIAGVAGWAVAAWRTSGRRLPPRMRNAAIGVAIMGVIGAGVAIGTGGLDREVLSQASRSLRFRLQYWSATMEVIAERPILGTGPGNFRQHYLRHKLAESSEEIADPHNLLLDVWANAGSGALLALLAILIVGGWRMASPGPSPSEPAPIADSDAPGNEFTVGLAAGFVLLLLVGLLFGDSWGEPLAIGAGSLLVFVGLEGSPVLRRLRFSGTGWAAFALLVHLLGAGGIAMPAIQLALLMLVVMSRAERGPDLALRWRTITALGCVSGAMFVGQLISATLPVVESGFLEESARAAVIDGQPARARDLFASAVERDRLAPERPETAGQHAFGRWRANDRRDDISYRRAIRFQTEAVRRDPASAVRRGLLAQYLEERFRTTGLRADGDAAVAMLAEAVARYPTSSSLRAQHALLLADLDADGGADAAATAATEAIRLDDVNRAEGHTDRVLPEETRGRLEAILDAGH